MDMRLKMGTRLRSTCLCSCLCSGSAGVGKSARCCVRTLPRASGSPDLPQIIPGRQAACQCRVRALSFYHTYDTICSRSTRMKERYDSKSKNASDGKSTVARLTTENPGKLRRDVKSRPEPSPVRQAYGPKRVPRLSAALRNSDQEG